MTTFISLNLDILFQFILFSIFFLSLVQTAIDNFLSNFFETVLISGQFSFFPIHRLSGVAVF